MGIIAGDKRVLTPNYGRNTADKFFSSKYLDEQAEKIEEISSTEPSLFIKQIMALKKLGFDYMLVIVNFKEALENGQEVFKAYKQANNGNTKRAYKDALRDCKRHAYQILDVQNEILNSIERLYRLDSKAAYKAESIFSGIFATFAFTKCYRQFVRFTSFNSNEGSDAGDNETQRRSNQRMLISPIKNAPSGSDAIRN